uniref:Uncharacterized protein n=1 Tax=Rangifer tarandus platyrhynchus TaxID=3082113 RepID=A0ACB0DPQ4_RANTA|nr:unnamed protein product [Rangifer tarandus platyrhynchus]
MWERALFLNGFWERLAPCLRTPPAKRVGAALVSPLPGPSGAQSSPTSVGSHSHGACLQAPQRSPQRLILSHVGLQEPSRSPVCVPASGIRRVKASLGASARGWLVGRVLGVRKANTAPRRDPGRSRGPQSRAQFLLLACGGLVKDALSKLPCCPCPGPPTRVKLGGNKPIRVPGPAGPLTPLSQLPLMPGPLGGSGLACTPNWAALPLQAPGAPGVLTGLTSVCGSAPQLLQAPGCGPGPWAPLDLVVTGSARPACERPLLGPACSPPPTRALSFCPGAALFQGWHLGKVCTADLALRVFLHTLPRDADGLSWEAQPLFLKPPQGCAPGPWEKPVGSCQTRPAPSSIQRVVLGPRELVTPALLPLAEKPPRAEMSQLRPAPGPRRICQ